MAKFLLVLNSLLFGLGSWVAITGLWLETPVLIHHLPEGWSLASYLTFSIQLANILPLIYWGLHLKIPKYCNEVSGTNLQLFIGLVGSIVLIFYWDTQTFIFDGSHSVVLLACAFLLSIVDCLSSVTFLPFMARFKSVYLTPYLIGEGLSGFLPTILAIIQNVEDQYNPTNEELYNQTNITDYNTTLALNSSMQALNNTLHKSNIMDQIVFGPEIFFLSLSVTLVISWIAFFYLQFNQPEEDLKVNGISLSSRRSFKESFCKYIIGYDLKKEKIKKIRPKGIQIIKEEKTLLNKSFHDQTTSTINKRNRRERKLNSEKFEYYYLQFLILFACTITFGLLPPLQPFSCLPVSRSTFKYTVVLSGLSYPVGCSIALFLKCKSIKILTFLTILATSICSFIIYCALFSPNLPTFLTIQHDSINHSMDDIRLNSTEYSKGNDTSSILDNLTIFLKDNHSIVLSTFIVSCWVTFNLILSYVKTMVTIILNDRKGEKALFFVGLFSQIGSVLGSAFMFIAINHLAWFNEK